MRAVTITRYGPPSVLEVREHPDPEPGPGQVRIDVEAAGLNFAEISARQGLYPDAPKPPCVVGYEVAGTIGAVGEEVDTLQVGDRVLSMTRFGGHASVVISDADMVFELPEDMSFTVAAAIPVNYLTAHHMLYYIGNVHRGSAVLVHMAAGGVGTAALQLLQGVRDLTVFGTASAGKHDYIRALGCTHPIDYHTQDYAEEVSKVTDGRGVDLILDPLGGRDWKRSWKLLAPAGRMVAFGFANAVKKNRRNYAHVLNEFVRMPLVTPLAAMNDNRSLQGVNLGRLWDDVDILRPQVERLLELFHEGVIRPHVHAEVPFERAAEAHEMLEHRLNRGKVVLVPE